MKLKKLSVAFLATSLLMTGCSSSKTVDGQSVIVSVGDKNIFADDIFDNMLVQYGGTNNFFEGIMNEVITAFFPVTSVMEKDVDDIISEIQAAYNYNYGNNADSELLSDLKYSGFSSLEEYRMNLIQSLQYLEFLDDYVHNNFDEVFDDYYSYTNPRYVSLLKISVSDTSELTEDEEAYIEKVLEEIEKADDFGDLALTYSSDYTARNRGRLGIVDSKTSSDTYGSEFMEAALLLEEGEFTSEPIASDGSLYFIRCDYTNQDDLKEILFEMGTDSPLVSYDPYLLYLIYQSYEVEFKDTSAKEIVETLVLEQLVKRTELREVNSDE